MQIIVKKKNQKLQGGVKKNQKFTEMQTELKAMNSGLNNAEKGISDLEDRITEIAQ